MKRGGPRRHRRVKSGEGQRGINTEKKKEEEKRREGQRSEEGDLI